MGAGRFLGFWMMGSEGESASNWEKILRELSERGRSDGGFLWQMDLQRWRMR